MSTESPPDQTFALDPEVFDQKAVLKISTIVQILKCLETAQSRGAYKAPEMSFVGRIYDGLSEFVQSKINEHKTQKEKESVALVTSTPTPAPIIHHTPTPVPTGAPPSSMPTSASLSPTMTTIQPTATPTTTVTFASPIAT